MKMNSKVVFFQLFAIFFILTSCRETPEEKQARYRSMVHQGDEQLNAQHFENALSIYLRASEFTNGDPNIQFRIAKAAYGAHNVNAGMPAVKQLLRLVPNASQDREVIQMRDAFAAQYGKQRPDELNKFGSNSEFVAQNTINTITNVNTDAQNKAVSSITALELRIVDKKGIPRIILGTEEGGGIIKLLNNRSNIVAQLKVIQESGYISIARDDGYPVALVGVSDNATGLIETMANGHPQAILGAAEGGNGALELYTDEGKVLAQLTSNKKSNGMLNIFSVEGNRLAQLTSDDSLNGVLNIFNSSGQPRAGIGVSTNDGGFLKVLNQKQKISTAILPDSTGAGSLIVCDENGSVSSVMEKGRIALGGDGDKYVVKILSLMGKGYIGLNDSQGNTLMEIGGLYPRVWSAEYPGSSSGHIWPPKNQ